MKTWSESDVVSQNDNFERDSSPPLLNLVDHLFEVDGPVVVLPVRLEVHRHFGVPTEHVGAGSGQLVGDSTGFCSWKSGNPEVAPRIEPSTFCLNLASIAAVPTGAGFVNDVTIPHPPKKEVSCRYYWYFLKLPFRRMRSQVL